MEWGEEERIRARQRQRRLHMLAQEDRAPSSAGTAREAGRTPSGEGTRARRGRRDGDARSMSRVPWYLLDELDAEKQKLRVRLFIGPISLAACYYCAVRVLLLHRDCLLCFCV